MPDCGGAPLLDGEDEDDGVDGDEGRALLARDSASGFLPPAQKRERKLKGGFREWLHKDPVTALLLTLVLPTFLPLGLLFFAWRGRFLFI